MQKPRFSNITSYKAATAPKTPAPISNAAALKKWAKANPHLAKQANIRKMRKDGLIDKETETKLLRANYDDRKAAIKKPAKGSAGQRSTTTKSTRQAPVQPKNKNANTGSGRDGRFGTGTYGQGLPSNPKLKSQPKNKTHKSLYPKGKMVGKDVPKSERYGKPKRSDYSSGRTGTAKYLAALRKYRQATSTPKSNKKEYDRRGRRLF